MNIVKRIVVGLVIVLVVLAAVGLVLPRTYKVERSAVINAPVELVFDQVNDLKKNEAWTPWKDPNMTVTYGSITAGKGAMTSWESKKMGNGSQTIMESVPNQSIKNSLDFKGRGTANVDWSFVPEGEGVKVTQTMSGDQGMNPVKRYFGLVMDKMVGPKFEQGLASLKQVSENQAAALKAQAPAPVQQAAAPVEEAETKAAPAPAPKAH
jgi:hypothetical protein